MKKKIVRSLQKGSAKVSALLTGLVLTSFAFVAAAAPPSIGATVAAAVDEYKEEALIAIFAFIVVLWTLKATGVLKPR